MRHAEPPPGYGLDVKQPLSGSKKWQTKQKEARQIVIKKPQIRDVKEILGLINEYAASGVMLPRGPQYLYENIKDFVIAVDMNISVNAILESKELMHLVVGCGSLHVLWEDVAEVRSLAINHDYQHMKIGRKIIEFMESEAKQIGIRRLYTFTNSEGFFKSLGFVQQKKEDLPAKVWGECSRCPKFYKCDEIGMMLRL